jgi:hypothetical protein
MMISCSENFGWVKRRINIGAYGGTLEAATKPADTDQDGIIDIIEDVSYTLINDADTDDDGILDGVEDANKIVR